jgi:hypothetical protein
VRGPSASCGCGGVKISVFARFARWGDVSEGPKHKREK